MRNQAIGAGCCQLPQTLGFTPQKPIKKAYEQRQEAVKRWLDSDYPAIEQHAKTEGAEIHWGRREWW